MSKSLRAAPSARKTTSAPDLAALSAVPALFFFDGDFWFRDVEGSRRTGKFLSPESVRAAFVKEPFDTGWIDQQIVRCGTREGTRFAVAFRPPGRFTIRLVAAGESTPLTLPLPGLVLAGIGHEYRIWAVAVEGFSPTARPFYVPLPNVFGTSGICWGAVKVPEASGETMGTAFDAFLTSAFTRNETNRGRSIAHPDNLIAQIEAVAASAVDRYPTDDMVAVPTHPTIAAATAAFFAHPTRSGG